LPLCNTPFFDQLLSFYSFFEPILPNYFLNILQFISQHFISLFPNILLVYILAFYPSILQAFYLFIPQFLNHLNLNFLTTILSVYFSTFHFYFLIFTRLLKLRSFVVSVKILKEMYFKIPHFCSEGTILSFSITI